MRTSIGRATVRCIGDGETRVRGARIPPVNRPWKLRRPERERVQGLVRRHSVTEVLARILAARGHEGGDETARHLEASLHALNDPLDLPDMEAATERIALAVERRERILVHGDYDVDGVTGTVLLMRLFALIGADAVWHIPHRLHDGYSFGEHSVAKARETGAKLVISVDNGTAARETIAQLAAIGVDTIVTDHHEPPLGELPARSPSSTPSCRARAIRSASSAARALRSSSRGASRSA